MLRFKTLLLIAIFLTGSAWADWARISGNAELTYYIDPATIRKDGNLRKVWSLLDRKEPDEKSAELSTRTRQEYDCKEERYRFLNMTEHSGQMATGNTLKSINTPSEWWDVPPKSMVEIVLKAVCSK